MALTQAQLSAEPYSQQHLFEGKSKNDAESLVKQLNEANEKIAGGGLLGYLQRARSLLKDAQQGKNPFEGLEPVIPEGEKLTGDARPGTEAYANFERAGMAEVSKCAFCLVAGGLGERLGYPGIKIGIMAEITTGVTFFGTYARFILAFEAYARKTTGNSKLQLPLAIMTSGDTHEKTVELLESNDYFGLQKCQVTLMKQELVPALADIDARIACTGGCIEMKPHGHGDVHSLLHQHGLPGRWIKEGRKWLLLFQDTNPLPFRCLCAVLGVSAKNDFAMNTVAVPRVPKEAIGGICTLKNKSNGSSLTINVEYNQLEPLLKSTSTGGDVPDQTGFSPFPGNTNVLVFGLPQLDRCLQRTSGVVPEFVNPKWADDAKTKFKSPTRLECMMQEFPRLCEANDRVGFSQLNRFMSFTCVKNNLADAAIKNPPDCALSAEADIYECNRKLLELAGRNVKIEGSRDVSFLGISAKIGPRIVLQPSFGISLEQIKERLRGEIRISSSSSLVLDGDIKIENLTLDGALEVVGDGTIVDKVVKNKGQQLESIPSEELDKCNPSLQIRGYRVREGEVERLMLRVKSKDRGCFSWCR